MIEVCVDSLESAVVAVNAGANRIELSEQLHVGGVSPSEHLIRSVREAICVPLVVLIRCRAGDFYFNAAERQQMVSESIRAAELGADGIAIGGLNANNDLDSELLGLIEGLKLPCEWVMHRAFDSVRNPRQALEDLIRVGFHRILTSGGPPTANQGINALKSLVEHSRGRIGILPAGGINLTNAWGILSQTHCGQLHGSFRSPESALNNLPDPQIIQSLQKIIDSPV